MVRSRSMKFCVAVMTFIAVMAGAWMLGLIGRYDRGLPDDHRTSGKCTLWFIGSSSIRRWTTLDQDMKPWAAHNRGVEGANFGGILSGFQAVSPSEGRPAAIILYVGENDIATGGDVRSVVRDLARFVAIRDAQMAGVPILALSMKPSPGREQYAQQQSVYNAAMRTVLSAWTDTTYVDITTKLLENGMPPRHYQPDGIHLSKSGYAIVSSIVRQSLTKSLDKSVLQACDGTSNAES